MYDMESLIIAKEKDFIICKKLPGMLSEPSDSIPNLPDAVSGYLKERGEKSSVYTVHRLDRGVGGLTLLARTTDAASYFASLISERRIEKKYLAVVIGVPEKAEDTLVDLLFRDASKGKTYVVDRMRKGVRDARLDYRVLETITHEERTLSLLEITLHTGRTHQIRVQFASRKLPLVGDGRYGSGDKKDLPALFAYSLAFERKKGGEARYTALPSGYPFDLFDMSGIGGHT